MCCVCTYIILYCIVVYCIILYCIANTGTHWLDFVSIWKNRTCVIFTATASTFLFLSFRRMYCIQFRSPEEYQYVPQTEKIGEFFRAIITTVVVKFQLKFLTHFLFFLVCRYLFIRKYPLFRIDWWVSICTWKEREGTITS